MIGCFNPYLNEISVIIDEKLVHGYKTSRGNIPLFAFAFCKDGQILVVVSSQMKHDFDCYDLKKLIIEIGCII
jgi:hypothetical protein